MTDKKKKVNSKRKGGGFELKICKLLSTALSPLVFKKTQQSGAIAGGENSKNNHHYSVELLTAFVGDIFPSNELDLKTEKFRFSIECKFYKSVETLQNLFENSKIKGWFEESEIDSKKINKEPIVIFKFNYTDIYVVLLSTVELPYIPEKLLKLKINENKEIQILKLDELLKYPNWWKKDII